MERCTGILQIILSTMCHTWKWFRKYIINKILSSDIYKYLSVADHLTDSERVARSY